MHSEIIAEIKNGNLKHLDHIYLEVKAPFLSFVKKNFQGVSSQEAEDVYQDSIIDLYKNIQRGSLTEIEISFSAYVTHIGKMKLIKLVEEKQKRKLTNIEDVPDFKAEDIDNVEWARVEKLVGFILGNIDEGCRAILDRYYFKNMSMDEIAKDLGYKNADVVKSKKNRCINRVYDNILKMYNEND